MPQEALSSKAYHNAPYLTTLSAKTKYNAPRPTIPLANVPLVIAALTQVCSIPKSKYIELRIAALVSL